MIQADEQFWVLVMGELLVRSSISAARVCGGARSLHV